MNPKPQHLKRLFYQMLANQAAEQLEETPELSQALSDEQLLAVIRGETQFTLAQQKLLVKSPELRKRLLILKQAERIKTYRFWQENQLQPAQITAYAAGSGTVQREDIHCGDYTLSIVPHDAEGSGWTLLLKLHNSLLKQSATGLRLEDQDGMTWIAGHPDEEGVIEHFWSEQESPLMLIKDKTLQLKPF